MATDTQTGEVGGSPTTAVAEKVGIDFVLARTIVGEGCWLWTGALGPTGYGFISARVGGDVRGAPAHRVVYHLAVGPIADGLELDHLCNNPSCVRPDHLEPVTRSVNSCRATDRRRDDDPHPLRLARLRLGLTADEVAQAIGVSRRTVHTWESGRHSPHRRHLARWQEVLEAVA